MSSSSSDPYCCLVRVPQYVVQTPAVMSRSLPWAWLRRYRFYFGIGILILLIQLYLTSWLPGLSHSGNLVPSSRKSSEASSSRASKDAQTPKKNAKSYELRDGDLEVYPGCEITNSDALNAISRATTPKCKQLIANVSCAVSTDNYYDEKLPSYCPISEDVIPYRYLGCYQDDQDRRLFDAYSTNIKGTNTPKKCADLCLQSGYPYAGVQYGFECFCGIERPSNTYLLNDSECDTSCPGDSELKCGGHCKMNVYESGTSLFVFQKEKVYDGTQKKAKIAFLLTLNGRAVRQVLRLLKNLYSPDHYYYIHVDVRQDFMYRELVKLELLAPNIRLARRRFSSMWGGASLLTMLMASMDDLLKTTWQWDFVINLSESDFPIKTVEKLTEFMSANPGKSFVKSHGRDVQNFIKKQGLDQTFVECDTHMFRIGPRTIPAGIQMDGGSDWICISRSFAEYINRKDRDELMEGLLKMYKITLLPAESFFHTALRNSRFCTEYVDNNLHLTNWKRSLGCSCETKKLIDWCGCSPNDYKPDDWPRIFNTESKSIYFARKFEAIINQAILLKVESWLHGQEMVDRLNVRCYWQNLYHHEDVSPKPDKALLTVAERMLHLKLSAELDHYELLQVLSIHIYKDNDIHRGMLVLGQVAITTTENVEIEMWYRPDQQPQASRSLALGKRISHLEVSSEYDKKERVLRNFVRVLSPKSLPTVLLQLREYPTEDAPTYNVTILWISPAGILADITELYMDDTSGQDPIFHSKSNLKSPVLPGVWTVKLIHEKKIVAKCEFMVLPTEDFDFTSTTEEDLRSQAVDGSSTWSQHLPSKSDTNSLIRESLDNSALVDDERTSWIEQMVHRFYVFKDICSVISVNWIGNVCTQTNWSSLAPDPKSDLFADLRGS